MFSRETIVGVDRKETTTLLCLLTGVRVQIFVKG